MLTSRKTSALREVPPTREEIFVRSYEQLRVWALHFSEGNSNLAEDLLHDAFIQFTISEADLSVIENIDGYLYVLMRNLHVSQVRRATRNPVTPLAAVEFDTANVGLWASDPRDRIRLREELCVVCEYACRRKETAKAGSVLILRFFHGYYPDEIARIMRTARSAVHNRLHLARAEAKLYLESPERLTVINETRTQQNAIRIDTISGDLRLQLRRAIFDTRQGECLTNATLRQIYETENGDGPDQARLAHIVACQVCIESVNTLLGLKPLSSRYPVDSIGNDPGNRGGGSSGTGGGGGGGTTMLDTFIFRRDEVVRHQPQELCVSVNGHLQGSQKVAGDMNVMTLVLDAAEAPGFVEVFSEQGLRLLMMNVETPPAGHLRQSLRARLSDDRYLDADLTFSGPFPVLKVVYKDPTLTADVTGVTDAQTADISRRDAETQRSEPPAVEGGLTPQTDGSKAPLLTKEGWTPFFGGRGGSRFSLWSWLQPARLTAAIAALLIVALVIFKFGPVTTVSAAELLEKSAAAEDAKLANKDRALHRTLDLEESKDGQIISRKKIDIWQASEKGITARRLYDQSGNLVMGDWRSSNGIQTIYQRGQAAKLQPPPEKRGGAISFDDAWQLSISAKEFTAMLGDSAQAEVETRENDYVVYVSPADRAVNSQGLTQASIVLSKEDLHAIEQTFTLQNGGETRDYRMVETGYDWKPLNTVAPSAFEPNIELTSGAKSTPPLKGGVADVSSDGVVVADDNTNSSPPSAAIATPALEVEIVEALNNANAFMGEQVNVSRTSDGKISVSALVETDQRKRDLLAALSGYKSNPAVRIKIETVDEAQARIKRRPQKNSPPAQPGTVQQVDATEGTNPTFAELKKKFSDDEARRFSQNVLNRSRQAWLHAVAMKQIADRFSPADLQGLSPAERGRWVALIRSHANAFINESEGLRRELAQVFPEASAGGGSDGGVASDIELQSKVRELYEASVAIDRGMDRSFGIGAGGSAEVKSASFWHAFSNALGLAKSLAAAK